MNRKRFAILAGMVLLGVLCTTIISRTYEHAQTTPGLADVTLSGSTPVDTSYKAGSVTLTGNVTAWAIKPGFDPFQPFGLFICQPANAVYAVTGAPANFVGTLLVPSVAGQCVVTGMSWLNGTWYSVTVPVQSVSGLAKVATSGAYGDLLNLPTIPNTAGFATTAALQAEVSRAQAAESTLTSAIPPTVPTYVSPSITTANLVSYGTQTITAAVSGVTTSQAFMCAVAGGGATTTKLTANAYVTTNGQLTYALTNESLITLPGTSPVVTAVCKPLN